MVLTFAQDAFVLTSNCSFHQAHTHEGMFWGVEPPQEFKIRKLESKKKLVKKVLIDVGCKFINILAEELGRRVFGKKMLFRMGWNKKVLLPIEKLGK